MPLRIRQRHWLFSVLIMVDYISELLVLQLRKLYLGQTMLFPLRFAAALTQRITLSFTPNFFDLLFGLWQLPVRARWSLLNVISDMA